MEAYETINGLFKDVKQDYIEYKLNERIMIVIVRFLAVLEDLGVAFDYEITVSRLMSYIDDAKVFGKDSSQSTNCKLAS